MQISHESPLCLLEKSREYNDYDYALVHLFEKYEQYYNFFAKSLKLGRRVILDNSLFELKESFDPEKFMFWIKKLEPTDYIIPDSFNNSEKTMLKFIQWIKIKGANKLIGNKIGVVHGRTLNEAIECYRFMNLHADKIAINAMDIYLKKLGTGTTKLQQLMTGRKNFINILIDKHIVNIHKKHHLMGNTLPQEGYAYKDIKWIESVDTSNPILHGYQKIMYNGQKGLDTKDSLLLSNILNKQLSSEQKKCIQYNIYHYRKIWE